MHWLTQAILAVALFWIAIQLDSIAFELGRIRRAVIASAYQYTQRKDIQDD